MHTSASWQQGRWTTPDGKSTACTRLPVSYPVCLHLTVGVDRSHGYGRYSIEFKGRQVQDDRALVCQYGLEKRLFRIADVSNGDFDEVSLLLGAFTAFSPFVQN